MGSRRGGRDRAKAGHATQSTTTDSEPERGEKATRTGRSNGTGKPKSKRNGTGKPKSRRNGKSKGKPKRKPPRRPDPSDTADAEVRFVQPYQATKTYRCPGCNGDIPAGLGHMVAVPPDAPDLRRHWHRGCWNNRSSRR